MHTFRKGQEVNVLNTTMSGTVIIEGRAKIVRPVRDVDDQYLVDFQDGFGIVERFIDPAAQGNDVGFYVARLNDPETHDENGGTTGAPLPGYLR